MRGFPSEDALEFFLAGDEHDRITRTARTQFARDFSAGDALRRIDDLQEREATAVADVEGFAGNAVDLLEGADVGIGSVEDMDVIADTGSIRRGAIGGVDVERGQRAARRMRDAG